MESLEEVTEKNYIFEILCIRIKGLFNQRKYELTNLKNKP
jgi:hypothetical protein